MLEQNSGSVDSPFDIDLQKCLVGEYYKVSDRLFETCIKYMKDELSSAVCVMDVNQFRVSLNRVNGEHWDAVGEVADELNLEVDKHVEVLEARMDQPNRVGLLLDIEYSLI
jgi:hypothetical protein